MGAAVSFRRKETRWIPPEAPQSPPGGSFFSPSVSGRLAERWVVLWLRCCGWRIVATNLRTPLGEVDVVAREGTALVIVEVKYRRSQRRHPLSSRQAKRLRNCARWLHRQRGAEGGVRIDLVEVTPEEVSVDTSAGSPASGGDGGPMKISATVSFLHRHLERN